MADRKALKRKQLFVDLCENGGKGYFPGCTMTLFPNGEKGEIWVTDGMHSMRIKVAKGRAGLSVTVGRHAGTAPITVTGNLSGDCEPIKQMDADEISMCQYNYDDRSQAFKRWYGCDTSSSSEETESGRHAYDQGREDAKADKPLANDPESDPEMQKCYERGYWAQKAGLHDKEA